MKKHLITRRAFLATTTTTAIVSANAKPNTARVVPGKLSPNEKLNIAGIGVGGKGRGDLTAFMKTENIVAMCDVDENNLARGLKRVGEGIFALTLKQSVPVSDEVNITVSVKDGQGNQTEIIRTLR